MYIIYMFIYCIVLYEIYYKELVKAIMKPGKS